MAAKIYGNCPDNSDINTGRGECGIQPDVPAAILITDVNARYPSDPDAFREALHDAIIAGDVTRILPVAVQDETSTGGEFKTRTVGDVQRTIGLTQKISLFFLENPDLCLYPEVSKTDGWNARVFIVYKNGFIEGTQITDGDTTYFAGYAASLYSRETRTTADGYNVEMQVTFTTAYQMEIKNKEVFKLDSIPLGLVGITLEQRTDGIHVVTACGGVDVGKKYPTEFDVTAFRNEAGASPTTATVNASTGVVTIAPAGNYRVAPAAILDGLGIIGFNGVNQFIAVSTSAA